MRGQLTMYSRNQLFEFFHFKQAWMDCVKFSLFLLSIPCLSIFNSAVVTKLVLKTKPKLRSWENGNSKRGILVL